MNFRQLKAFDTVMRLGSITGAAKALHVSQPSVTRLVHELETHLGFALFLHRGRGIATTVERRFHQAVESAFMNIERLDDLAATIRKTAVGKVSVGVIDLFIFAAKFSADFAKKKMTRTQLSISITRLQLSMRSAFNSLILVLYRALLPIWVFTVYIRQK